MRSICILAVARMVLVVTAVQAVGEETVSQRLGTLLESGDVEGLAGYVRALDGSTAYMTRPEDIERLLHEIGVAVRDMPRIGHETGQLIADLGATVRSDDHLLPFLVAAMTWSSYDRERFFRIVLANAPNTEWKASAASGLCWSMQETRGYDAAIESTGVYLQCAHFSDKGRSLLRLRLGIQLLHRAILRPDRPETQVAADLSAAEEELSAARANPRGPSAWAGATSRLAELFERKGDRQGQRRLLLEIVERRDVASGQRAAALRSLALGAAADGRWEEALEYYEKMKEEDYRGVFGMGFDLAGEIEAVRQRRYPIP